MSPKEPRRSGRRSNAPSQSHSQTHSQSQSNSPPPHLASDHRPPLSHRTSLSSTSANVNGNSSSTAGSSAGAAGTTTNGTSNSSRGGKKPKQEDADDVSFENHSATAKSPVSSSTSGRAKRTTAASKAKDKEKDLKSPPTPPSMQKDELEEDGELVDDEEQEGITRCVCGSSEDDPDAGEFMVQCEICKVWQHGLCMGYKSEDQLDDDYYCEECKPELHVALLKQLSRSKRHPSHTHASSTPGTTTSTTNGASHSSIHDHPSSRRAQSASAHSQNHRHSRSQSPVLAKAQPAKRRNTMNSRDAAFDESIKEVMEASAAEAGVASPIALTAPSLHDALGMGMDVDEGESGRKKRKRTDDDAPPKKRTRSASAASDLTTPAPSDPIPILNTTLDPTSTTTGRDASPAVSVTKTPTSMAAPPVPPAKTTGGSRKKGGQRKGPQQQQQQREASVQSQGGGGGDEKMGEGDETPVPPPSKRGGGSRRTGPGSRRVQNAHASEALSSNKRGTSTSADPTNPSLSTNGHTNGHTSSSTSQNPHTASSAHDAPPHSTSHPHQHPHSHSHSHTNPHSKAYKNTHAYAVSLQPPLTSWNLPDYLGHLEHILPSGVPRAVDVCAGARAESWGVGEAYEAYLKNTSSSSSSSSSGPTQPQPQPPPAAAPADSITSSSSTPTITVTLHRTHERGAKVKWPAKRMSVGDMNKRVRALIEWVVREQGCTMERGRRRDVLEETLRMRGVVLRLVGGGGAGGNGEGCNGIAGTSEHSVSGGGGLVVNGISEGKGGYPDHPHPSISAETRPSQDSTSAPSDSVLLSSTSNLSSDPQVLRSALASSIAQAQAEASTVKMMESLMEDLMQFQERFGPGSKARDRERVR